MQTWLDLIDRLQLNSVSGGFMLTDCGLPRGWHSLLGEPCLSGLCNNLFYFSSLVFLSLTQKFRVICGLGTSPLRLVKFESVWIWMD